MAGQDVLVTYRADVDDLTQKLKIVIDRMDKLEAESKQAAKGLDTTTKSADKLGKELADVGKTTAKATADVKGFAKTAESTLSKTGTSIKSIGLGMAASLGAAFTVEAVIEFGKASVEAFLLAEKSANRLKFAVMSIGGESESSFNRLLDQSKQLAEITLFDDKDIQGAQALLSSFDLTAEQIEKIIPKLANYATIVGTDLTTAANRAGSALQGNNSTFSKFGVTVSNTATTTQNFESILLGLEKTAGAASKELDTVGGKIQQIKKIGDEFKTQVGEKLIDYFSFLGTQLKETFLNLFDSFKEFFNVLKSGGAAADVFKNILTALTAPIRITVNTIYFLIEALTLFARTANAVGAVVKVVFKEIGDVVSNTGRGIASVLNGIVTFDASEITKGADLIKDSYTKAAVDVSKAWTKGYNQIASDSKKSSNIIIDDTNRILTAIEVQTQSTENLIKLKDQLADDNTNASRQNIEAINKELERRDKLNVKIKDNTDARIAGSAKEIELIKSLGSEYSDLFALLSDTDKAKLIELSITGADDLEKDAKDKVNAIKAIFEANKLELPVLTDPKGNILSLQDQIEKLRDTVDSSKLELPFFIDPKGNLIFFKDEINRLKELYVDNKLELPVLVDSEGNVLKLKDQVNVLRTELESNSIKVSIDYTNLTEFRTKVAELAIELQKGITIPVKLEVPDDRQPGPPAPDPNEDGDTDLAKWLDRNQVYLDASIELYSSLTDLYDTYNQAKLEALERETDEEIAQLDKLSEANQENFDKQRISEREFANNQKKIEADKIKVQQDAEKKSREIKRKAAILDKAAALFQIAISTAQNIASTKLVPLIVLYAAAGAAQAAIVAAQPIPYAKGTKSAKEGMARVGEQGEEIMYVPGGTKVLPNSKTVTYGSVLDKMFDGTFDKYYMKREIAPRMVAQRKAHEATKEKSFARNISESIVLNSSLDTNPIARQLGKGQRITNVDEIADAIARRTEISPYRR